MYVTRPGIVIGRKGGNIKSLTDKLESDFGLKNPQVAVEEVSNPDLSPSVMCNRMAVHIERGIAFRRATMWTIQQIMDGNAMGVQITISGKLRGDRSAFEKHSAGILPRAGEYAKNVVSEDIVHTKTKMGLIGIRIRIANKEKIVPEFKMEETLKPETEETKEMEQKDVAKTESEQIKIEGEKMKSLVTLEEEEQRLK